MYIKQLTVFIENREGRLEKVSETLKANGINIASLSLADTSEYGLLRMIVSDPEKAKQVLKENGFSAMLTDVLAVRIADEIGMLQPLLKALSDKTLNIEYMYALTNGGNNAAMIIKVNNLEKAVAAINDSKLELVSAEEAYTVNK